MSLFFRMSAFIGGVLLLMMAVGGMVVRREASTAYLIALRSVEPEDGYGVVVTTPEGHRVKRLFENGDIREYDRLVWAQDGKSIYYLHVDPRPFEPSTFLRVRMPSGRIEAITEPSFASFWNVSPDGRWAAIFNAGNAELYVLNTATGEAKFIEEQVEDRFLWSADSQWIFYVKLESEGFISYHVSVDGTQRYTDNVAYVSPVWSPVGLSDQQEMVYLIREDDGYRMYHKNLVTSKVAVLPVEEPLWIMDWFDNNWIVFQTPSLEDDFVNLLVRMRPDGSEQGILSENGSSPEIIARSSDSEWIYLLASAPEEGLNHGVYRVDMNTLENEYLMGVEGLQHGMLSENGDKIVFLGFQLDQGGLYTMNVDGSDFKQVLSIDGNQNEWSFGRTPDPDWVQVGMRFDGFHEDYSRWMINIYTGEVREMPRSSAFSFSPIVDMEWSPEVGLSGGALMILGALGMALMNVQMRRSA